MIYEDRNQNLPTYIPQYLYERQGIRTINDIRLKIEIAQ